MKKTEEISKYVKYLGGGITNRIKCMNFAYFCNPK